MRVVCQRPCLPLVVLASVLAACPDTEKGKHGPEAVATLNGVPISAETFERELAFTKRTSQGVIPQSDEGRLAFKRAVLEDLINRQLVLTAAREAGIEVTTEDLDREILKLNAEYHGGAFNEALADSQLSQQELQERTRVRLVTERYFVDEVFSRVAVIDREIEAHYAAHTAEYVREEEVRASQIVVKTQDDARAVQAQLKKGMTFDEAARRYSLSPDARVGGDLGFFARGLMPPAFDKTCFSLAPGKVSEIVESEYGFHLFKVVEKRSGGQVPLEKLRGEIERKLLRDKQEEAQRAKLEVLRTKANIQIDEAALARIPL